MAGTRIGQRIGPFELAERLDGDGSAALYRAVRPAGSREPRVVAIRVADDPRDERAAAWIRNEYDVLRALSEPAHPAILRPYGYYASQVAVAMEDIDGVTLADALRLRQAGRVPIDAATAVDILLNLAQALRHAHSTSGPGGLIMHGHLNPDRVQLTRNGQVKVLGFGRAAPRRVPSYTPPEQAAGAFLDARSDQWALGSLGIEMLLGQALYSNTTDPTAEALSGRVGPWLDRLERRWPEVCRVLARCLAPAAGDRYEREADLVHDLLTAGRTIGGRADVTALASRVAALLPPPEAPVQSPAPTEGMPQVKSAAEPKVDSTLVPLEDDIDPDSARRAAQRLGQEPRRLQDQPEHPALRRAQQRALLAPPEALQAPAPAPAPAPATAHVHLPMPILVDRSRLEEEITDPAPGALLETLPADAAPPRPPTVAKAPAQISAPEPDSESHTPVSMDLPRIDEGLDPAPPRRAPAPPDEGDDVLEGLGLGVGPAPARDPEEEQTLSPDVDPAEEEPETHDLDPVDPGAIAPGGPDSDEEPLDENAPPNLVSAQITEGLRLTELLAVVMMALLLIMGLSFVAWRFF